jgi:hypothetical protein
MYHYKKVVAVTPSGRKKYLEVLKDYIVKNPLIDEWQLWQNTNKKEDIEYINFLHHNYQKVNVVRVEGATGNAYQIHKFFKYCTKKDTVYIRLDDDVVWMKPDSIEKLLEFRINNPEYFLVYGNTVNNCLCDYLHQQKGALQIDEALGYDCMDLMGWETPYVAEKKHKYLLLAIQKNEIEKYNLENHVLTNYERCSINVISWLGEEFYKFKGEVGIDEEMWLSVDKPKQIQKPNVIFGKCLFSHFSFFTQSEHMEQTDILERYEKLK